MQRNPANVNLTETGSLKQQFIHDYGQAYQNFGLPRLMGCIVGVLLYADEPLSLDDITEQLHVSKGPVSQIMRRLRENALVQRVWVPGTRRDYYRAEPDIFGQAFGNHADLLGQNLVLARKYSELIASSDEELPAGFRARTAEMVRFYTLMEKHLSRFLAEWEHDRNRETGPEGPGRPE